MQTQEHKFSSKNAKSVFFWKFDFVDANQKVKSAAAKIILGWDQFDILGLKVEIVDFFWHYPAVDPRLTPYCLVFYLRQKNMSNRLCWKLLFILPVRHNVSTLSFDSDIFGSCPSFNSFIFPSPSPLLSSILKKLYAWSQEKTASHREPKNSYWVISR